MTAPIESVFLWKVEEQKMIFSASQGSGIMCPVSFSDQSSNWTFYWEPSIFLKLLDNYSQNLLICSLKSINIFVTK